MTFRELTELQEKIHNAAHMSAVTHMVETKGLSETDCDQMESGRR